jgi:hypothetical protein
VKPNQIAAALADETKWPELAWYGGQPKPAPWLGAINASSLTRDTLLDPFHRY